MKAGPVLYKMMLHYGSFPFPAEDGTQLTLETFCLGIVMLSRIGLRPLLRLHNVREGESTRKRQPDVRLFFQSLSRQSETASFQNAGIRSIDDDEDLIDALMAIERGHMKFVSSRNALIEVASGLPSSHSRNLQGAVSASDFRVLIELDIASSYTFTNSERVSTHADTVERVMGNIPLHSNSGTELTWDDFNNGLVKSMVS